MELYTFETSSAAAAAAMAEAVEAETVALLMVSGCTETELSVDVSTLVDAIHFEMP